MSATQETRHTPPETEQESRMIEDDRAARIEWSTMIEPGDAEALRLIGEYGACSALEMVRSGVVKNARWTTHSALVAVIDRSMKRLNIRAITPFDPEWPTARFARLEEAAPIILYVLGDVSLLKSKKSIAIVGARAATGYGEHVTMEMSSALSDQGFTIVSGAAYGIDGTAHRAALSSGGKTVAVLAGGVDRFYPAGHDALLNRITQSGAVVSELPPGSTPTQWRFLRRNRIIGGLSDALVAIEAGAHSGSLNAARQAWEAGIPVGAVPGPVTSAASTGTHDLIRKRTATLVTCAADAVELTAHS